MRITQARLKQIIREELQKVMESEPVRPREAAAAERRKKAKVQQEELEIDDGEEIVDEASGKDLPDRRGGGQAVGGRRVTPA
jgi:hypothetical protein